MTSIDSRELEIPAWCPDHIAHKARELCKLHCKSPIAVAVIEHLATDPKMKRVWDEFRKRSRNLEDRHQPAGPRYRVAKSFEGIDEQTATAGLFERAVDLGRLTLMLPSNNKTDELKTKAASLRADAKQLQNMQPRRRGLQLADRLLKAADIYDSIEYKPHDQAQAIACEIVFYLQSLFESPMHTAAAAITSLITERKITKYMIYNWVRALKRETQVESVAPSN
jgi:hypothetical protein